MGSASDYAEAKILDHLVGKTSFTMPTCYIALSTADPTEDGSGIAEPVATGYARQATAGGDWNAATVGAGATSNANAISFGPAAGGAWGAITHFAGYDALTVGNMLFHGALSASKTVADGDSIEFAAGDLDITCD